MKDKIKTYRHVFKIYLLISSLFLVSCSEDNTTAFKALPANATILAFGDSLTAGKGSHSSQSYPAVLQKLTQTRVINAGISGEVSASGLKRLPKLLKQHKPELVIICHGGNDILRKYDLQKTKNNIIEMIDMVHAANSQVLLLATPKPTLLVPPAKIYFDIAETTGVTLDADTLSTTLKNKKLKSDTYHPNASGYQFIAEQIHRQLKTLGAI